jgi:hypothetical protein
MATLLSSSLFAANQWCNARASRGIRLRRCKCDRRPGAREISHNHRWKTPTLGAIAHQVGRPNG